MSELGFFAIDRGIWDHPMLQSDVPFSKREAWMWIISAATWSPRLRVVLGRRIKLRRGQIVASSRYLSKAWRWSEPKTRRFLKLLKNELMIDAATDAGVTVLTVCNYNKYQKAALHSDAPSDAMTDAGATHHRRKYNKVKKGINNIVGEAAPLPVLDVLLTALDAEHAQAVIDHRKKKKLSLSLLAIKRLTKQLAKWPDPNEAAAEMVLRDWKGFDPSWMVNIKRQALNGHSPPSASERHAANVERVFTEMLKETEPK